jgi:hypothetical protein
MTWRDAVGNASTHDLVRQLAVAPLADWSTRTVGLFAGERQDLAHLLWAQPRYSARSWRVSESLRGVHLVDWNLAEGSPAMSPQANCLHVHWYLLSDIGVAVPHCG